MQPGEIAAWVREVRTGTSGPIQLNNWIPDAPPARDHNQEATLRTFLANWGPEVGPDVADQDNQPDFDEQCQAMLDAAPAIISSIMGLYPAAYVSQLKARGIAWFATATTVLEATQAEAAGADVIVAQGMEAGGHRGAFDPGQAETALVGLISLVPTIVDAVKIPVVAAGGIADGRGVAAALALGASAVQIGTGFLRCPESRIPGGWREALGKVRPEETALTRAFSGRPGRSVATAYTRAAAGPDAPAPGPYPIQRRLTAGMRAAAAKTDDLTRMQAWAGQSASLSGTISAEALVRQIWSDAREIVR
jgi:nitronate monooxygenase